LEARGGGRARPTRRLKVLDIVFWKWTLSLPGLREGFEEVSDI